MLSVSDEIAIAQVIPALIVRTPIAALPVNAITHRRITTTELRANATTHPRITTTVLQGTTEHLIIGVIVAIAIVNQQEVRS
jgi:hypothetical protein